MDWAYKAVLTATVVAAVMMTVRLFGRRQAGLLAGLPVITAPALLWLAQEQGAAFAAASAVGSLVACAAAPLFALSFVGLARRHGGALALAGGLLVFAAALVLLSPLQGHPMLTLPIVVLVCLAVRWRLARQPAGSGWVRPLRGEPWLSAAMAGLVVAVVTLAAQPLGPFWSGVATTLPVISACALLHLRRAGTAGDLALFVWGYAGGSLAKAAVLAVFCALVSVLGAPGALALGLGAGLLAARWLLRRPVHRAPTIDAEWHPQVSPAER